MPEERERAYLDDLDDAWYLEVPGWDYAPGFDEWNDMRLSQGQRPGSFTEYMRDVAPMLAQETESEL